MKKIIKRFWGVGLIVIILSTLIGSALPVSGAEALRWESKTGGPTGVPFYTLATVNVADFVVSPDTKTMYAACGTILYQSTGGGSSWTNITTRLPTGVVDTVDFVAMAPDDPNVVVVVDATGNATDAAGIAISVNGGVTFTDMGFVGTTATILKGAKISAIVTGGYRYVAVYGQDATTNTAVVYYFNYGSGVGAWRNAVTYWTGTGALAAAATIDNFEALVFSPNFASDYMALALSEQSGNATDIGMIRLHAMTFNTSGTFYGGWDASIATGYPVTVSTEAAVGAYAVNSGSIAIGPDFMGGDETLRIAFVGADVTTAGTTTGGIWRCNDTAAARHIYEDAGINSVAFDGTNLVAGAYTTNNAYHCADPLASQPTVIGARSFKRIGVDDTGNNDQVLVKYVGETVFGSKQYKGGAISKSVDDGNTWNDFTLINQALTTIYDIYVSADGATWYMSAADANVSSVFRMSPMQRVLCTDVALGLYDFRLRGVASDANVVYAYDQAGTTLFYTADGGVSRWQQRLNVPAAIADLAVESANVIYFANAINIYKSINNGFTWNTPVNTTSTGNLYTLLSLGENKLVAGGVTGQVLYSKDGAATWTRTLGVSGAGNMQVAASGLETGNFIFASGDVTNAVYRCEIGPSNPVGEFKSMNVAAATSGEVGSGLAYVSGVLYALSQNTTTTQLNSILTPTMNPGGYVPTNSWRTRYDALSFYTATAPVLIAAATPSSLKVSTSTGKITLWAIRTTATMGVRYFDDTLALVGPTIASPADKALVQTNSITGLPLSLVLIWNRPSLATSYDVWFSTDNAFTTIVDAASLYVGVDGTRASMSLVVTGGTYTYNPGTTYYWKVRAATPVTSAWSETRSFTIQPVAASVPGISSPVNGSTIASQSPAFSWSPVTSTTKYEFQLSTTPTFGTTVLTDTPASAGTLVPVTIKLDQGKQYFWRVRALEPVQGDWSTVANFIVATPVAPTTPFVITQVPAPIITIPAASPVPAITLAPQPIEQIAPTYIWAIIIIGGILVIAVIVLIVRTRRSV